VGAGVKAFQVRNHPEFMSRCFFVLRTDGSSEDFSYRKCAEALMPDQPAPPLNSSGPRRSARAATANAGAKRGLGARGAGVSKGGRGGRGVGRGRGAAAAGGRGGRSGRGGRGGGRGGARGGRGGRGGRGKRA